MAPMEKGFSWSNIAVGKLAFPVHRNAHRSFEMLYLCDQLGHVVVMRA